MNLIDWFKHKLTPAAVAVRQTDSPRAAQLHREFANHPARGLTPARLVDILMAAEQGDLTAQAELFMDMEEKDAHIAAELSKRKMAVKKLDWVLEPPRGASAKEKKATQALEQLIRDELDIDDLRMDMLDAIGHGYACIELGWGRTLQGLWFPNVIEHRPPSWFTCPQDSRNTLHLRDSGSAYGVPLQPGAGYRTSIKPAPAIWPAPDCTGFWPGRICSRTIRCAIWPNFLRSTACRSASANTRPRPAIGKNGR